MAFQEFWIARAFGTEAVLIFAGFTGGQEFEVWRHVEEFEESNGGGGIRGEEVFKAQAEPASGKCLLEAEGEGVDLRPVEEAFFERLGYIDCQHLSARIQAETLFFVGLMDTICPPSTQFAAYNRIPAKKRTVIYPDFGHEGLPGHGDLIYNFLGEL